MRSDSLAYFVLRFTIVPPADVIADGAIATLELNTNRAGTQIYGGVTGNVNGWTTDRQEPMSPGSHLCSKFVFTAGPFAGSKNLSFELDSVGYLGGASYDPSALEDDLGTFTFTSPGQPVHQFRLLRENTGYAYLSGNVKDYRTGHVVVGK